jgi:phenylacetate-CoA ligase
MFGHPMMSRLRMLEEAQWWPRDRLEQERNRRLAEVVSIAHAEVPFYRELFDQAGVRPSAVTCLEDLQKLPIVTKRMLREGYPDRVCRRGRGRTYETSTSGSTGQNLFVREDRETAGWYRASFLLALEWAGWRIGEPHMQMGMTTRRNLERRLKDALMGCYYVTASNLSNEALDHCLDQLDRKRIRHVWGYPGSIFCLARRARERGWNTAVSSIVTWGDQLHEHWRKMIEKVFKVRVTDTYGCGEGMQIAAQCGNGPHYHIHELDVVAEFLDDEGEPVPAGMPGNIVLTRLQAGPMPFIRYALGDIGTSGGDRQCACGRTFRLLDAIQGRSADYVLTPSGNRLIVHFFTGILEHFREIESFQVIQNSAVMLRLNIVPAPAYTDQTQEKICRALRDAGANFDIHIQVVENIPLTRGGKRRFIIRDFGPELQEES